MEMSPTSESIDQIYANDVICQFSEKLNILLGEVVASKEGFQVTWTWNADDTKKVKTESVADAAKEGKIFLVSRRLFIGSLVEINGNIGIGVVSATNYHLTGVIEKISPGGTKKRYVLSKIPVERLAKVIPCKVKDYISYENWIGQAIEVTVKTTWSLNNSPQCKAVVTVPLKVFEDDKFVLGKSMKIEDLEKHKDYVLKSSSWWPTFTRSKGEATLTEINLESIKAYWLHQNVDTQASVSVSATKPASELKTSEELVKVKRFHLCKDDWEYFGTGECFHMKWTEKDEEGVLELEEWEKKTFRQSTALLRYDDSTNDNSTAKRSKQSGIFQPGEDILVTSLVVEIDAVVTVSKNQIDVPYNIPSHEICKVRPNVIPRLHLENPTIDLRKGDMVQDRSELSVEKYGFVLNEVLDGSALVKWIKNLGPNSFEEWSAIVLKNNLVPFPTQVEFNVANQAKIVKTIDGVYGTVKGVSFPICKVVVRETGSFKESLYLPHEIIFFMKGVFPSDDPNEETWKVRDIKPNYPHLP